jgi:hypothetical protein
MPRKTLLWTLFLLAGPLVLLRGQPGSKSPLRFEISFPSSLRSAVVDGRVLLMLAKNDDRQPRFQIGNGLETQQIFGVDAEDLAPGKPIAIDGATTGYPRVSLNDIPAGDYYVQALLNVYETFHRSDGHTVKLPMDDGEGQHWNTSPGNLYSEAKKIHVDRTAGGVIKIELRKIIPPITPPKDTKYIKHIKIQSQLLTKFWGRPMYIGGVVLLPEGFDEHPAARYPVMYYQGHFTPSFATPVNFREQPPTPDLKDYERTVAEYSYKFYQDWTSGRLPRMLIVSIQHANPYYDDSYAVNSANLGPYGDAIVQEFMPYVEKRFRAIGEGWARVLYGGSTGGWEALTAQIFYPEEYNGCWASCPDPIDFRAYTVVNIYDNKNAYYVESQFLKTPRPGLRNYLGEVLITLEDMNRRELVLGTHSRSGEQWDIWQAVYSPLGSDGYPKPIWDKLTGRIDHSVAAYWRENYDLGHILRRDWPKIGNKLEGKIHIYCGTGDNYFLNNAVYLVEDILKNTKDPYYGGEVDYGDRAEHCWNGDHTRPNAISRLRYHQMHAPKIVERIRKSAPVGADTTSWRY